MCIEYALCQAPGSEQRKAQDDCVRRHGKERRVDVVRDDHVVYKHGVDADAHHNEKALECQGKQAPEIVCADAAPFPVRHRRKGDGRDADGQVDLDHPAVEDDRYEDGHDLKAEADQQRFDCKAQQLPNLHGFHAGAYGVQCGCNIDARAAANDPSRSADNMLPDVEDRHHDVEGVGEQVNRNRRLEKPPEKHPCVHVMHVVSLRDHRDQLIAEDKGNDDPGDGDDHVVGQPPHHGIDAAVPA